MDELNREMHTMSDMEDESFIVLGSSPTPSMEQYVSGNEQRQESMTNKRCAQTISNNFSLVRADDPLKSSIMMTPPQSIQSVQSASTTARINGSNSQSANVIMGNIKTSSLQNFPSEMRSSLPIVESQLAQHLTNGHEQLKEYIEMTNVALRESLTSLQKWHEENNAKHKYNQVNNNQQTAIIDQLKEENYKLKQLFRTAETRTTEQEKRAFEQEKRATEQEMRATEQEKRATEQEERADNLEITLERAVDEAKNQIQAERVSALAEIDELKKNVSEKESILKKTIDQHKEENHRLEQLVRTAETRAKEQEKRAVELENCLTEQEKRFIELEMRTTEQEKLAANLEITLERALTEMDELKKNVSEKESILKNITDQLKEENHRLEQLVRTAETQATEQEKRATEQEKRATEQEKRAANLESALVDAVNQNLEERGSALAELDELKKDASDKESIRKNMAQRIERLELEKQELVIAKQKQLDTGKIGVNFITIEEHNRQIEVLRREIATIVAKNLEFEEMVPTTIIPARVMENLDVLLHDAGRASLKQIRLLYDRPLINLGKHNPSLSQLEAQKLALVKGVRQKLNQMQRYLIVCRIADKLRLVHENIGDRQYLMQAVNIYSISDLLRLENGELSDFLLNVLVEFEQHIRKCEICSAKAYNCEDCQNGELLFPFDEDAIICTSCYSMSHRSCLARQNQFCQKCRRLLIRRKLGERS